MLFRQEEYINLEYNQRFKEQIEVLKAYNGGVIFGNSPGETARDIATLGLDAEIEGDVKKSASVRKKKILGDRLPTHIRQASVQRAHPIA